MPKKGGDTPALLPGVEGIMVSENDVDDSIIESSLCCGCESCVVAAPVMLVVLVAVVDKEENRTRRGR